MSRASGAVPRAERAQATRQHILGVAIQLFGAQGYAATSLSQLVAASGLTRGAFYFHFPSKQALALAAFRFKQQQLLDHLSTATGASPLERLRAMLRLRALVLDHDPSYRGLVRLCADLRAEPELADEMRRAIRVPIEVIASLLTAAQARGQLRADAEPQGLARVIFALLVGLDELAQVGESTSASQLTEIFIEQLLPGLLAPRAKAVRGGPPRP
jgi:AcrR family transcriptional regulator